MGRSYIAFISYRHLPLEMATAKKLHRRIERYVIPKDLRKDGRRKPGLVFRDQDELPSSSNLGDNIREALDSSEFLIVICTPETSKSPWVLREISYFLERHDRSRVLAVLADGTPAEAFPAPLTELRSESGDLIGEIEPLAANIVADSEIKRARLFPTESLRIIAALIGCPFDALYRREQRFRRRRSAVAAGAAALIAAAFIGMLANRNAEIRAQLAQSQINESRTLAALSEQAYREGDYAGALRYALGALPGEDGGRPYVGEAELALSRELDLYRSGVLRYVRSTEQDSPISLIALSEDGSLFAASDEYGSLRCRDAESGTLLWERGGGRVYGFKFLSSDGSLLVLGEEGILSLDPRSGETRWERSDLSALDLAALSTDESVALMSSCFGGDGGESFFLLDLGSGETARVMWEGGGEARICAAASLSEDKATAALLLQSGFDRVDLYILRSGGEPQLVESGLHFDFYLTSYKLTFSPDGGLLLACDDQSGQSYLRSYWRNGTLRFDTPLETEKVVLQSGAAADPDASVDFLDCVGDRAVFCCKHDLYMIDLSDGGVLWHLALSGFLLDARLYFNACMGLVLSDGTVSFCSDDGVMSDSAGISNFRCGYPLAAASVSGENYPEIRVAAVPEAFPQRAAVIRYVYDPQMYKTGAFPSGIFRAVPVVSPSGERLVCLGYDRMSNKVWAMPIDAAAGEAGEPFPLPGEGWGDPGLLSLSDDGVLSSPLGELELDSRVFTASAGEGAEEGRVAAGSADGRLGAVWDGETLLLSADGRESAGPALPPTTVKLLFSPDGRELLAFSETGELLVIRPSDGELLLRVRLGSLQLRFRASGARYSAAEAVNEDRLLIFYDGLERDEAICLVYDRESRSLAGAYDGVAAYMPERDAVLVCPFMDGVYVSPFRSGAELVAEARSRLGEAW